MSEELIKLNFIEEYTKRVKDYTDAPEVFIRGSAYYLVSATLGEFYRNRRVPFGVQRPNLWVILSSIPGRMRRSTIQGLTYKTFREIIGETAEDTIIEEGSPEGIMDAIGEEPQSAYTIQSTEFGSVLSKMGGRHYEAGVLSIFSKLYYGESGKQSLSQRGGKEGKRTLPGGLYVTMLVGMQEPQYYLTPRMLYQGLLRRPLIIYVENANRWLKPLDDLRSTFQLGDLVSLLRKKREELLSLGENVSVVLPESVDQRINQFSYELDKKLDKDRDDLALYKQTLWEHLLKLTTLHAIARGEIRTVAGMKVLRVTPDDLDKAEDFLKQVEMSMESVIDKLGEREMPIRTLKRGEQRVLRYVRQYGVTGIGLNQLGAKFPGLPRKQIEDWISSLVDQNKLTRFFPKTNKPGRPPMLLIAKEHTKR